MPVIRASVLVELQAAVRAPTPDSRLGFNGSMWPEVLWTVQLKSLKQ